MKMIMIMMVVVVIAIGMFDATVLPRVTCSYLVTHLMPLCYM